jgi:adenylate kinase
MKHKILFAGIDGSGKSTCMDLLISRLQSRYSIMKIGNYDPYFFHKGERKPAIKYRYYKIMDYIRPIAKKCHFYSIFLIFNFTYKFIISKYLEFFKESDIIIYDTDTLLHPAVYITYHMPFSKVIKSSLRLRICSVLFGSKRNFSIFYLDTDPEVAMKRIHKRAETGVDIHSHENIRDLKTLKKEFDSMVEVASENGFEIFKINTNERNLDEVVKEVQTLLEKKLLAPIKRDDSDVVVEVDR